MSSVVQSVVVVKRRHGGEDERAEYVEVDYEVGKVHGGCWVTQSEARELQLRLQDTAVDEAALLRLAALRHFTARDVSPGERALCDGFGHLLDASAVLEDLESQARALVMRNRGYAKLFWFILYFGIYLAILYMQRDPVEINQTQVSE
jgi:hypothetical protein